MGAEKYRRAVVMLQRRVVTALLVQESDDIWKPVHSVFLIGWVESNREAVKLPICRYEADLCDGGYLEMESRPFGEYVCVPTKKGRELCATAQRLVAYLAKDLIDAKTAVKG
jgi:hypothetical protein